eukprot:PLAT15528.6.p1 GENE.PLAT15528.6~~PLAT15528.6.p1  ORF type:complete len:1283 (+),score=804.90 PLAT15528.6:80-3928(+)
MASTGVTLSLRHVFGLKGDVKDNVHYLDENLVLYPAGFNVAVYNTETKAQRFILGTEGFEGISAMAVSPNKRVIAVAERAERGLVTLYDGQHLRKRKTLASADIFPRDYVSMCFSADNRYLLTQGGAPDWTLICWQWDKNKVVASTKSSNVSGAPIHEVSFCPTDSSIVLVTGNGIVRFFRIQDGVFKALPSSIAKRDPQNYLCHTWLPEDRVVVGTDTGDLLLFESFELRTPLSSSPADGSAINCILAYSGGFVCGCDEGILRLYNRSDDMREYYSFSKPFTIEENPYKILNLAVSPSEDSLACTLENHQMYVLGLNHTDILKAEDMSFDLLTTPVHGPGVGEHAHITGLDTCVRKPLVVTCGLDKTVRVWNYLDRSVDLMQTFSEEAYCAAFHPSGLHILVGFSDKLRLMNLLMEDIREVKSIPIKACPEVAFSNGGHLFAAVNGSGSAVQVYSTYTGEMLLPPMRGHNGKVRSLYWSADDRSIISAGDDGSVYQWILKEAKRDGEFVQKGINFNCAICNADGTAVFAVGSDTMLKEIEFPIGQVTKEFEAFAELGQLVLAGSQRVMFAGTCTADMPGIVRSYKFPLTSDVFVEYQALSSPITRMCMSADDSYLFAAGADGCLMVFEVREKSGGVAKRDKELSVPYSEEILVTKVDLDDKHTAMMDLRGKVEELRVHNDYQLRLKEMGYGERIKEVTEKFTQELEQDRNKFELLREEKNDMEMEYEEKIKQMEEKHQQLLQEIEASYQQKIMNEVEKYQQLSRERDLQSERYEQQRALLDESHARYIAELTEDFEQKLDDDRQLRTQMADEIDELKRDYRETQRQLEEDIDLEIEELKAKYVSKLDDERAATLDFKGDNGIMKKKFSALLKDIDDQREEIKTMKSKERELYETIKGLEKDIQGHKKEIRERDETIYDKDKRIYDLKKKNQELEKFKFVLDYKITELVRQIQPRQDEISDMRNQIKEMRVELSRYHKSNALLDLMISELRLKQEGMEKEIAGQQLRLQELQRYSRRFRNELATAHRHRDYKALKTAIVALYKTYVQEQGLRDPTAPAAAAAAAAGAAAGRRGEEDDSAGAGISKGDPQREYNRQREYLEKSVESLKRKLAKDMQLHRNDRMRLMRENVALTKEINELRRELYVMQHGGADAVAGPPAEDVADMSLIATEGVDRLFKTRTRKRNTYGGRMRALMPEVDASADVSVIDTAREIERQRATIRQLKAKIAQLEELLRVRPSSASRAVAGMPPAVDAAPAIAGGGGGAAGSSDAPRLPPLRPEVMA